MALSLRRWAPVGAVCVMVLAVLAAVAKIVSDRVADSARWP